MAQMELASLQVCVWVGREKPGGQGRWGGGGEVLEGWPAPYAHDVVLMAQMELASLQVCVGVGCWETGMQDISDDVCRPVTALATSPSCRRSSCSST